MDYVAVEMGMMGGFKLVLGDTVLDPDSVSEAWLRQKHCRIGPHDAFDVRRVELRHWGIFGDVTLTLVATQHS